MNKWYDGIYRRHLLDMHISDERPEYLSRFDADDYYDNLVKAKIQCAMIYLQSHTGLCNFKAGQYTHKRFAGKNNEIMRLISKCRQGGIKTVGYYSLIFNNRAADIHPEWEMVNESGKTWRGQGRRYGLCCPNNVEYRKFVSEQIKLISENFKDIDGIFYDMPYWEMVCRCKSCRKRWSDEEGGELPPVHNFDDADTLKLIRKRQDWMAEFVRFVRAESQKYMPSVTVEFNYAAVMGLDWISGSAEGINDMSEFTGGDLYGDLYNHSFVCKYYYNITNNRPFEYMTCRCDDRLTEHTVTKSQNRLESEILLTCAHHGASLIIDAIDPVGTMDKRVYERVGKVFSKQIPYEKYMDKGELYAEIAVYFDSRTQFENPVSGTFNKRCAINAVKTFAENHIPVAVVSNGRMQNIDKYRAVIAPSLQNFENDEIPLLTEYVGDGGNLYISGESDSRLIKTFFGAEKLGYTYGINKRGTGHGAPKSVQCYIRPCGDSGILGEFTKDYPMPVGYKLPLFRVQKGRTLAAVTLPYTDPSDNLHFASIHSNPPGITTDYPAIVCAEYGRGKVFWSLCCIEDDTRHAFAEVFLNAVNAICPVNERLFDIKTSASVETVIFKTDKGFLISFADLSEEKYKRNAEIKLKTSAKNITAKLLPDNIKLPFIGGEGFISCTLEFEKFAMAALDVN